MAAKKTIPIQARPRPTLKAWLEYAGNRQRLTEILSDPVFLVASSYVCDSMQVTPSDLTGNMREKVMLGEEVVRKAALHAGAVAFTGILRNLLIQSAGDIKEPEAWEHVKPDPE